MALGTRRAQAATAYIVARGIDASRVITGSRGESQPVTDPQREAGQALNRRAMFRLVIAPDRKPYPPDALRFSANCQSHREGLASSIGGRAIHYRGDST